MGSTIIPLSDRFTLSTSDACFSGGRLRWTKPIPPCCAIAIASRDSVTVSMAALTMGIFRLILRVRRVCVETSAGKTSDFCGTNRTSSKVSPSGIFVSNIASPFSPPSACFQTATLLILLAAAAWARVIATNLGTPNNRFRCFWRCLTAAQDQVLFLLATLHFPDFLLFLNWLEEEE